MSRIPIAVEAASPGVRLYDAFHGRPRHENPSLMALSASPGVRRLTAEYERLAREVRIAALQEALAAIDKADENDWENGAGAHLLIKKLISQTESSQ
jgi:hypothetical protein